MLADRPHGRRLTAAEQMRLDQLERQLREDDPLLAAALSGVAETRPRRFASPPRWALVAGTVVAAALLILLAALVGGAGGAVAVTATLAAIFIGRRMVQRRRRQRH